MGGRKNIERFSKDKDLASVRTLSMNLMKSELPLESSYCWPPAFLHMLGPFKPLPSTLFPTFLGESWLYLSRSSLGPSQPQQSSPCWIECMSLGCFQKERKKNSLSVSQELVHTVLLTDCWASLKWTCWHVKHHSLGLYSFWQLPIILCHTKMLPHRLFPRERCWSRIGIWSPSQAGINYDIKFSLERDQANSQLWKVLTPFNCAGHLS